MAETNDSSKIAIIGMSCRLPGADNVDQYWDNLVNGRESISLLSQEELLDGNVDPRLLDNPAYVKAGSFIEGFEYFDHEFFNYTLREASVIDPQHRLFLECSWHALEDACVIPGANGYRIGVFAGCHMNSYLYHVISNPDIAGLVGDLNVELGNEKDYLATRVSYKMDLRGPSMNIQTACSSSLVAVHMAVQSLLNGECDIALAGGVTINDFERTGYLYQPGGIKSPDGHCRTFDNDAEGTIFGNGLGVVVLKRLEDARNDGNHIYASIIGSAINNDGADKVGLAAPSFSGQRDVIEEAILMAGIKPFDLSYIECHGTATRLGDSIEVSALKDVFSEYSREGDTCGLGSVKTNVGHLNKASGIAGLIKTVLAIRNKVIPPTLHYKEPNPLLELDNSPFYVVDKVVDLSNCGKVIRAGVSSFGVGGTNAHIILEEVEAQKQENSPSYNLYLLPYSGKSKGALERVEENMYNLLRNGSDDNIKNIAYSLQQGRAFFPFRKFMIVDQDKTIKLTSDNVLAEIFGDGDEELQLASVGVLYSGRIDGACEYLKEMAGADNYFRGLMEPLVHEIGQLIDFDFNKPENANLSIEMVNSLASFILQSVIARLLTDFSVKTKFIAGVNDGELAAACSAGMMSWKDGLLLLLVRGKIIDRSALASLTLSPPENYLILGQDRMGNSSIDFLSVDYWLQEETGEISEKDFARSSLNTSSAEDLLFIRIGMIKDELKDDKNKVIKVIDSIDFIDNRITLLPLMGKLWANRLAAGFDAYSQSDPVHFVSLPTYPFEKTKCWLNLNEGFLQGKIETKSIEDFLYVPAWQQVRKKKKTNLSQNKCWLFMKGEDRWIGGLKQEVRKAGHMVIPLGPGEIAGEEAKNPEDYQGLMSFFTGLKEAGMSPDYLVYSLIAETPEMSSSLLAGQKDDLYALLRITCAFEAVFNREARMLILTNNAYSILGEKADNYFVSIFKGACMVIPQEFPRISCLTIDVDSVEYDPSAGIFQNIIGSIQQTRGSEFLVYRKNCFWKKTYEKVDDFAEVTEEPLAIESDGVYVISGGTGGIGLEVIEYLINRNNPKIAVISRNATGGQRLDNLAKKATELKLFKADVTDAEALEQVFREIRTTMGEIKGVFHLAGLPGKGLILNKKKDELNEVLGPKLEGTLLLGSILKAYHPDFLILFSSMIALKGGTGQIDYCGANSFLDNYAVYNTQQGMRTVSINWDAWQNTGMAFDSSPGDGLSPQQAGECLDYVLRNLDNPRIIVSANDVNKLLTQATKPASLGTEEKKQILPKDISYEFVFNKLTELFTLISENDEIGPDELLEDIGIDSVLLLQLFNEIDSVFPGIFSISKFYIYPTLNEMADYIYSELTVSPAQTEEVNKPDDSKLADYMKKIKDDDVSIEEAVKYLFRGESDNE